MNGVHPVPAIPSILAPAGSRPAFLAALAAGADAVYCGLKQFSARMEAKNFTLETLAPLVDLAHQTGVRVFVTLNTLVKPAELDIIGGLIHNLIRHVGPDGIIVQDLAVVSVARGLGFTGEIHLSTLANVSFPAALERVKRHVDVNAVVLPRELSIDEIRQMAGACPQGLGLEVFVHGALCYGVSGRCYWSSYLGGKSGLRGRCVQPCRRQYRQDGPERRYFSCRDLSLDVLVKVLRGIPEVTAWKIEGRKKGPHYVYYTVQAYRMLRDLGDDPAAKRSALQLLEMGLGRTGTHYHFLPQRPQNPIAVLEQTGSGFLVGTVKGSGPKTFITPRIPLMPGDTLRVGYEDNRWHAVYRMRRHIPGGGRFFLNPVSGKLPQKGSPVFLTDRLEKALLDKIRSLEGRLAPPGPPVLPPDRFRVKLPRRSDRRTPVLEIQVFRTPAGPRRSTPAGFWLPTGPEVRLPGGPPKDLWWWLPPVVWPEGEADLGAAVNRSLKGGGRNFVLNAPWQVALFGDPGRLNLWAGPFCNLANALGLEQVAAMGFTGAIVSPELGRSDYLDLPRHSPLPLGIVLSGNWPLCVSRILADAFRTEAPFTSPMEEQAWVARHGDTLWVFPNWRLDLVKQKGVLQRAGYTHFVHLVEPVPDAVKLKNRPGLWNWETALS